jgi:hypothetical protein
VTVKSTGAFRIIKKTDEPLL